MRSNGHHMKKSTFILRNLCIEWEKELWQPWGKSIILHKGVQWWVKNGKCLSTPGWSHTNFWAIRSQSTTHILLFLLLYLSCLFLLIPTTVTQPLPHPSNVALPFAGRLLLLRLPPPIATTSHHRCLWSLSPCSAIAPCLAQPNSSTTQAAPPAQA